MSTRDLIDFAQDGNAVEFRNALYSDIHDRVTAHIEAKKKEIAGSIFDQNEEVEELGEYSLEDYSLEEIQDFTQTKGYDSRGAYEKHDPKHPDFAKNYKKYKATNPQGQIGDFVAHMKKQK
jgi:hypothetical protein